MFHEGYGGELADKLKFGFYWGASCGGCEIAVLDTNEKILDIVAKADIVLWPVAMDAKYSDVCSMPDRFMDVCFFNGAVRNSEQAEMARLLRKKSKTLIAFGACAHLGGIPALANMHNRKEIYETLYLNEPSVENPQKTLPRTKSMVKEGELTLPRFFNHVYPLDQVVPVDYYIPGCPPPVPVILKAMDLIFEDQLPSKGTVLAPVKTLCDECPRNKNVAKKMTDIKRTWEIEADPEKCFLEQGIICMGPVTRAGCECRCINANQPCTGCMGPAPEVRDQGAKMISALASILKVDEEKDLSEEEIIALLKKVKDPVGSFYMFGLGSATINQRREK
ncbi:oxidoreductase [candidate division WOR-3 bacterium JGI_Cruoil_03_51_56]|uniref:Oxidoreductase n=1 Tax=candidate division WOR-3 bacterium JGI_Cruoil_03_51_56 TaxID=1973747 RepID=A0A235BPB8_UNCW3|nr:MAG: oxidoreductase [candidate division WOR-3 bacterium JGI_Cruoil_03_51_56]